MRGSEAFWPAGAGVRLLAVLILVAVLFAGPVSPSSTVRASVCAGDEQLLLAPSEPRVGEPMIVAAVSRFPHERVVLRGPEGPLDAVPMTVGDRFVWQATLVPETVGELTFTLTLETSGSIAAECARVVATSGDAGDQTLATEASGTALSSPPSGSTESSALFASLHPWQAGGVPAPASSSASGPASESVAHADDTPPGDTPALAASQPTRTPRPTRTPSRQSQTDNGNENDNEADPTPTKTPTPTRTPTSTRTPVPANPAPQEGATKTPTPTRTPVPSSTPRPTDTPRPTPTDTPAPTPTLAAPDLVVPASGMCGQPMTLRGQRFGSSQRAVSGTVTVDGRDTTVISWSMTEIEIKVPLTIREGNDRAVTVQVAGKVVTGTTRLSCS